jgi:hypothetical protein
MTGNRSQELVKPRAVELSAKLGYAGVVYILAYNALWVFLRPPEELGVSVVLMGIMIAVVFGLVFGSQRGDEGVRLYYLVFVLFFLVVSWPRRFELTWDDAIFLPFLLLLSSSVALLFTKEARAWFTATAAEQERVALEEHERMTAMAGRLEGGPLCATCQRLLERMDLGQGAQVVIGRAPVLYRGIVCTQCGRTECSECLKGSAQDAPCRYCGASVHPAYAHYLR